MDLVAALPRRNLLAVAQMVTIGIMVAEVAGPVVLVTGIGVGIGRLMEGRQLRSMRAVMLRVGVCPTCAYDLRSLEEGVDGLTVCAECGGSWAVPVEEEPAGAGVLTA